MKDYATMWVGISLTCVLIATNFTFFTLEETFMNFLFTISFMAYWLLTWYDDNCTPGKRRDLNSIFEEL